MSKNSFKNKYIIIYPYKFVDTLFTIMGLDGFSESTEVIILDLSNLLNKRFSNSIGAQSTIENVIQIKSFRKLISEVQRIRKQSDNSRICINYMIPLTSFREFIVNIICYIFLKNRNFSFIRFINTGLPSFSNSIHKKSLREKFKELSSLKHFVKKVTAFFWCRIKSPMRNLETVKLIAGKYYLDLEKGNKFQNQKILKGHSFDYDRFLTSTKIKEEKESKQNIVFLDEPGPMFASDYKITGEKVHKTIAVWYPALCKFFDKIEGLLDAKVVIAAHYKSAFTSPSDTFGGREVFYGRTKDLIENAKLVITEQSTAISYGVLYSIPIWFIYSDESKKDTWLIRFIDNMTSLLNLVALNINELNTVPENLREVDQCRYSNYLNLFLTSEGESRTNSKLIEQEIFGI